MRREQLLRAARHTDLHHITDITAHPVASGHMSHIVIITRPLRPQRHAACCMSQSLFQYSDSSENQCSRGGKRLFSNAISHTS
jgi:hypothetical protein